MLLSQRRGQVRLIPRGDGTGTPVDTQIDDDDGWTQLDAIYRMRMKLSQFVSINSYYGADLKDTNDAIKSGDLIHHLMTVTKPLLAKIRQDGTGCHWLETGHEVRTILRDRFALHSEDPKIVEALDKFSHHKGPSPPQPACAIYVDMINTISTAFESFMDDKAHTIDDRSEWKCKWWARHTSDNEHDQTHTRRANAHMAKPRGNRANKDTNRPGDQDRRIAFHPDNCPAKWITYSWAEDHLHVSLGYNTNEEPIIPQPTGRPSRGLRPQTDHQTTDRST